MDQTYWQGILSSEPETGGFNLVAGGFVFFPIPAAFGTACGLGYLALNMAHGQVLLPDYMEDMGKAFHSCTKVTTLVFVVKAGT